MTQSDTKQTRLEIARHNLKVSKKARDKALKTYLDTVHDFNRCIDELFESEAE